jgi:hypothetical protein
VDTPGKPVGILSLDSIHFYFHSAPGNVPNNAHRFWHALGVNRHQDCGVRHAQEAADTIDPGGTHSGGRDRPKEAIAIVRLDNGYQ